MLDGIEIWRIAGQIFRNEVCPFNHVLTILPFMESGIVPDDDSISAVFEQ